jgi:DNA invertase Pin-like site-specific DNA recombinase
MEAKRFIAYYRVSTDRQGQSGLGLEAQQAAVTAYVRGVGGVVNGEETEIETGRRVDRPALARALDRCRQDGAILVIAKLDRLARNVHFISGLMVAGVEFLACDYPEANRLTIHIMAAVAEHEAEAISARTSAALGAAKARGQRLGWSIPGRHEEQRRASARGAAAGRDRADSFALALRPVIQQIEAAGIATFAGVAEALNARGIRTARGRRWYPTTVRNVVARCAGD